MPVTEWLTKDSGLPFDIACTFGDAAFHEALETFGAGSEDAPPMPEYVLAVTMSLIPAYGGRPTLLFRFKGLPDDFLEAHSEVVRLSIFGWLNLRGASGTPIDQINEIPLIVKHVEAAMARALVLYAARSKKGKS